MLTFHAFGRALILVLLGVFLRSTWTSHTNWTFEDTLTQIGLGYGFLFLLGFRIGLNVTDGNVIDVGYAGVIGAQRVVDGHVPEILADRCRGCNRGRRVPLGKILVQLDRAGVKD